jgi:hypothetical protein
MRAKNRSSLCQFSATRRFVIKSLVCCCIMIYICSAVKVDESVEVDQLYPGGHAARVPLVV